MQNPVVTVSTMREDKPDEESIVIAYIPFMFLSFFSEKVITV